MNATKKNDARDLQAQWERAMERAAEEKPTRSELNADALNEAAGLHVDSGVKGGAWSYTCRETCGMM